MDIKNDVINIFKSPSMFNIEEYLNDIEISKINNLNNNTSNIYDIIFKKSTSNYICKIFDITKNDTKKYLGENEFYFYKNMVNNFKCILKIPIFYGFIKNNNDETYGLLLQKLNKSYDLDIENIKIIINHISKLHTFYWNNIDQFSLGNSNDVIENRVKAEAKHYFYNIPNVFDEKIYNIFNQLLFIKNDFSNKYKNKTILHGSLKIENIILVNENDEIIPYFIDWGLYKIGYGIEDILFLLIFSLNEELLHVNCDDLLEYYYTIINKSHRYRYEDFINHIKISLIDFILCAIIGLFIKNHFSKVKNNKLTTYLNNYLYFIDKYNII
jgi:hypothetical protein